MTLREIDIIDLKLIERDLKRLGEQLNELGEAKEKMKHIVECMHQFKDNFIIHLGSFHNICRVVQEFYLGHKQSKVEKRKIKIKFNGLGQHILDIFRYFHPLLREDKEVRKFLIRLKVRLHEEVEEEGRILRLIVHLKPGSKTQDVERFIRENIFDDQQLARRLEKDQLTYHHLLSRVYFRLKKYFYNSDVDGMFGEIINNTPQAKKQFHKIDSMLRFTVTVFSTLENEANKILYGINEEQLQAQNLINVRKAQKESINTGEPFKPPPFKGTLKGVKLV
jgi:hypothetical protein